jgi:hypothetical protein
LDFGRAYVFGHLAVLTKEPRRDAEDVRKMEFGSGAVAF